MSDKTSALKGPKTTHVKVRNVTRTMTTATAIATLIKGSRILGFLLNGTPSNATLTANVSLGTVAPASNNLVNGASLLTTSGTGPLWLPAVAGSHGVVLTADTVIYALYAETGTASSAGTWTVSIVYTDGNIVNDDTI